MSTYIRDQSQTLLPGNVPQYVVRTTVNWPFIIGPVIILGAGMVYVLLVIWETVRLELPVWKDDLRFTLAFGLTGTEQAVLRQAEKTNTMEKIGELLEMSFDDTESEEMKLRLIQNSNHLV
jgi:hypothetical protein